MKNIIVTLLIILIGFNSCSKKKEKKKLDNERYKREWVKYKSEGSFEEIIEYYISKQNDSIHNQHITVINGKIDSTKSSFYDLNLVKSKVPNHYNGVLRFYPKYNKELSNKVQKERTLSFLIFQKNNDSLYIETFESNTSNEIKFELVNYESDQLSGILTDLRFVEENEKDSLLMISYSIAIDHKLRTHNMGIEIYLEKR